MASSRARETPAFATARDLRSAAGDAAYNAERCGGCCLAKQGPYQDAVLVNAAAALMVAGQATNWRGMEEAAEGLDKGPPTHCSTAGSLLDGEQAGRNLRTKRVEVANRRIGGIAC
ncbi:MAG: hypothetical protein IPO50_08500 [Sphingomonadales bacterium]|nr:hypothetical protein [Sphingomonadales bacterium]